MPSHRPWWRRVGDAFTAFIEQLSDKVETLSEMLPGDDDGKASPPSSQGTPEPVPTPKPPTPPREPGPAGIDFDNHGPYPSSWDFRTRELWDMEPNTVRDLYSRNEWEDLQEAFEYGWIATGMSKEDHDAWREIFYNISGVTASSFDWEAFREYWADRGSPTVGV